MSVNIKAIKERLAKAKLRPWEFYDTTAKVDGVPIGPIINSETGKPIHSLNFDQHTAEFIAAAPEDITDLIAEIERLQTLHLEQTRLADKYILERDSLKREVAALRNCIHWLTANDHAIGVAKKRLIEADAIAKEREGGE